MLQIDTSNNAFLASVIVWQRLERVLRNMRLHKDRSSLKVRQRKDPLCVSSPETRRLRQITAIVTDV